MFSKPYGYEVFQNGKPTLQNHTGKFDFDLNLSLISNKALNLHSVMCSETNFISVVNITLL